MPCGSIAARESGFLAAPGLSLASQFPGGARGQETSPFRRRLLDTTNTFLGLCVVFFLVFLIQTYEMEEASSYLLPRMVSVFGLVVSLLKLVVVYLRPQSAEPDGRKEASEAKGLRVTYSIAFVAAYFLATLWLGFILSTAGAIMAFSYLMNYPRKMFAIVLSIAIPLLLHLAFVTLLQAPLPSGFVERILF